jgi:hypothetical protein
MEKTFLSPANCLPIISLSYGKLRTHRSSAISSSDPILQARFGAFDYTEL